MTTGKPTTVHPRRLPGWSVALPTMDWAGLGADTSTVVRVNSGGVVIFN
jgi:hypothetical protein